MAGPGQRENGGCEGGEDKIREEEEESLPSLACYSR